MTVTVLPLPEFAPKLQPEVEAALTRVAAESVLLLLMMKRSSTVFSNDLICAYRWDSHELINEHALASKKIT